MMNATTIEPEYGSDAYVERAREHAERVERAEADRARHAEELIATKRAQLTAAGLDRMSDQLLGPDLEKEAKAAALGAARVVKAREDVETAELAHIRLQDAQAAKHYVEVERPEQVRALADALLAAHAALARIDTGHRRLLALRGPRAGSCDEEELYGALAAAVVAAKEQAASPLIDRLAEACEDVERRRVSQQYSRYLGGVILRIRP